MKPSLFSAFRALGISSESLLMALTAICGALFALPSVAGEQVVADDPFSDGMLYQAPGSDPLGLTWFSSESALSVVDGEAGLGDGKALFFSSKKDFGIFTTHFPAVALTEDGDTLTVEFDYRLPTGSGELRFGLYDSGGTLRTSDNGVDACIDDRGYGVNTNADNSSCFREAAGDAPLGGGRSW